MRKVVAGIIPFLFTHFLCCGALLFFLISSGYLLLLRQEATNKIFLLPALVFGGIIFGLYRYHGKCCQAKGHKSYGDQIVSFMLYVSLSMILGLLFMIYVFLPWWIPNYKGGILLP